MFNIFGPIWITLVLVLTTLLKDARCCQIFKYRVTEEAQIAKTAVWSIPFLINMFTALKGSQFFFCFLFFFYFNRIVNTKARIIEPNVTIDWSENASKRIIVIF